MNDSKGKILLIDDDEDLVILTQLRLEDAGYRVITNGSALGASKLILRERPDLLLLDVNLPGLSGGGLAQVLGGLGADFRVPTVFYSSRPEDELRRLAEENRAIGYLRKSADWDDFVRSIDGLFEQITGA